VNGRKRHIAVDTLGLLLTVAVHPANIQDRDGAILVLAKLKPLYCFLQVIFADSAYTGDNLAAICLSLSMTLILVHRLAGVKGFLPKRWIVERTLGWLSRQRRLSKDYEELIETSQAIVEIAAIRLMLERVEKGRGLIQA
jgi:putative transposase